jgi:hypothetical protein
MGKHNNPKHKSRSKTFQRNPTKSKFVLVSRKNLLQKSFDQIVQFAIKYTRKYNVEVGFLYDKNYLPVGDLMKGWEYSIALTVGRGKRFFGSFHTHTKSIKTTTLGIDDLDNFFLMSEMQVCCPHLNQIVTLRRDDMCYNMEIGEKLSKYLAETRKYIEAMQEKIYIDRSPIDTRYTEYGVWYVNEVAGEIRKIVQPILKTRKIA